MTVEEVETLRGKDKNFPLTGQEVTDDQNPDCFVIVYAVDDKESFSKSSFY